MASSRVLRCAVCLDAANDSAQTPFRQFLNGASVINNGTASANQTGGGVFPGGGAMAVTAGSGMAVVVAAGLCCVPNDLAIQGGYLTGTMTSASLTLAAADSSLYRIDLICVTVNDTGFPSSDAVVQVVTGTPAASPSAPSLPADSIPLAQVLLPPGSSSVTSGNVTDLRAYVVAPGGVLPISASSAAPAAPEWQLMYDIAAGSLVQGTGVSGTTAPLALLPWDPVVSVHTSNVDDSAAKGVLTTICTASITSRMARRTLRFTTSGPG